MSKKLTRSQSDKMLYGVLGGIAQHYNLNARWLRIGVVVGAIFSSGLFIIAYVASIFIIPKDAND